MDCGVGGENLKNEGIVNVYEIRGFNVRKML